MSRDPKPLFPSVADDRERQLIRKAVIEMIERIEQASRDAVDTPDAVLRIGIVCGEAHKEVSKSR